MVTAVCVFAGWTRAKGTQSVGAVLALLHGVGVLISETGSDILAIYSNKEESSSSSSIKQLNTCKKHDCVGLYFAYSFRVTPFASFMLSNNSDGTRCCCVESDCLLLVCLIVRCLLLDSLMADEVARTTIMGTLDKTEES